MRFYQVQAFIIAALAASAHGLVIPDKTPIEGYGVFIPQWEFDTGLGAEKVAVNGTVEDLLEGLRPYESLDAQVLGPDMASGTSSPVLQKRDDFGDGRVLCYNFPKGLNAAARDGINLLKQIRHRRPTNQAGPGECGRMSCSENTAIWWCNELSDLFVGRQAKDSGIL
ncbi:hypothetical protein BDP81DRAFT_453617 [Colletotrichum phormii]|uniref:Uncharacterized protein n=1 Tax=Colletotrichum phormii TaxID=359342 RepID=A0AAI9ZHP1_9PEZI|nr:uncharacterized protein BDP81DRAFT_453617 [Colletotrichum phormii]KAK1624433.1 hypothetical protein BDP81DRAFT_453617 [Colletotrichum phormii]